MRLHTVNSGVGVGPESFVAVTPPAPGSFRLDASCSPPPSRRTPSEGHHSSGRRASSALPFGGCLVGWWWLGMRVPLRACCMPATAFP